MSDALATPEAYQITFTLILVGLAVAWVRASDWSPFWGWAAAALGGAAFPWMLGVQLSPAATALLLLPPLAFAAGFLLPPAALVNLGRIWSGAGTLAWALPVAGAFAIAHFAFGVSPLTAAAIAFLLACGDFVALSGLRDRIRPPRWLAHAMEAQHLLALGLSAAGLAALLTLGNQANGWQDIAQVTARVLAPVVFGGLVGYLVSVLARESGDTVVQWLLSVFAAYAAYLTAERFGGVGVLAAGAAGATVARRHARDDMSLVPQAALVTFWEGAAILASAGAFLLAGVETARTGALLAWPIWAAVGGVLLLRPLAVLLMRPFVRRTAPRGWRPGIILFAWASMSGPLPLALALALPTDLDGRAMLISGMLFVALGSTVVQTRALGWLAEWLAVDRFASFEETRNRLAVALLASSYASDELDRMAMEGLISPQVRDVLRMRLADEEAVLDGELALIGAPGLEAESIQVRRARVRMILAQREAVLLAARLRIIDRPTARDLMRELDEALSRMPRQRR